MTHGHSKTVCTECDKVISQCRCMSKDKRTVYDTCDACKIIAFHQEKDAEHEG